MAYCHELSWTLERGKAPPGYNGESGAVDPKAELALKLWYAMVTPILSPLLENFNRFEPMSGLLRGPEELISP